MYSEIAANKRRTILLIFCFFALIGFMSFVIAWYYGNYLVMVATLVFATGYVLWGYYGSDQAVLSMNNAVQIEKSDNPRLWRIVENLSISTGLPMPKVYVIDDPALNAFATGRDPNHASVSVTTGLLSVLDDNELQGVMAHEMGHIQNYDIRLMMIVFGLVAAISIISDMVLRGVIWRDNDNNSNNSTGIIMIIVFVVAVIIAPIVATLVKLSISRKREYLADATGALTTRYPEGLASALQKIADNGSAIKKQNSSTAHLFFANPLKSGTVSSLFSTHPPIEDRIAKLTQMGEKA